MAYHCIVGTYEAIENRPRRKCQLLHFVCHCMCLARILETSSQKRLKTHKCSLVHTKYAHALDTLRVDSNQGSAYLAPHNRMQFHQKTPPPLQLQSAYLINVGALKPLFSSAFCFHWLRFDQCYYDRHLWWYGYLQDCYKFMLKRDVAFIRSFGLPLVATICFTGEPYSQFLEERPWPILCKTTTSATLRFRTTLMHWCRCAKNR